MRHLPILNLRVLGTHRTTTRNGKCPTRRTNNNSTFPKRLPVRILRFLYRLLTINIRATRHGSTTNRTTSRTNHENVGILFPLITRGTIRLIRRELTMNVPRLLTVISTRRHRDHLTTLHYALLRLLNGRHFRVTTIMRANGRVITRVLTTRFPLPKYRTLFQRRVTYRQYTRFRLPTFTIHFRSTIRRAIRATVTRLMIRPRTVILPTIAGQYFNRNRYLGCNLH